jgi:HlyD family secretion protein
MGQPAKVTIDALPGQSFTGKVTEIGNSPIQTGTGQQSSSTQATNFKVVVTLDREIAEVRPGFTCTAEITTAVRDASISVPIQATTVREVVLDDKGNVVRPPENEKRPSRPAVGTSAQAAELKPGQTRKETEGVFLVQNNKAQFVPVKTGIAGEKYFEVLSGLKEGDAVITGPFSSVRSIADGAAVKISTAPAVDSKSTK